MPAAFSSMSFLKTFAIGADQVRVLVVGRGLAERLERHRQRRDVARVPDVGLLARDLVHAVELENDVQALEVVGRERVHRAVEVRLQRRLEHRDLRAQRLEARRRDRRGPGPVSSLRSLCGRPLKSVSSVASSAAAAWTAGVCEATTSASSAASASGARGPAGTGGAVAVAGGAGAACAGGATRAAGGPACAASAEAAAPCASAACGGARRVRVGATRGAGRRPAVRTTRGGRRRAGIPGAAAPLPARRARLHRRERGDRAAARVDPAVRVRHAHDLGLVVGDRVAELGQARARRVADADHPRAYRGDVRRLVLAAAPDRPADPQRDETRAGRGQREHHRGIVDEVADALGHRAHQPADPRPAPARGSSPNTPVGDVRLDLLVRDRLVDVRCASSSSGSRAPPSGRAGAASARPTTSRRHPPRSRRRLRRAPRPPALAPEGDDVVLAVVERDHAAVPEQLAERVGDLRLLLVGDLRALGERGPASARPGSSPSRPPAGSCPSSRSTPARACRAPTPACARRCSCRASRAPRRAGTRAGAAGSAGPCPPGRSGSPTR